MMLLTKFFSRIRISNLGRTPYIIPSQVRIVNSNDTSPKTILSITPHLKSSPGYYEVGFIRENGSQELSRKNQSELRLLFLQGYKVSNSALPGLSIFLKKEDELKKKEIRQGPSLGPSPSQIYPFNNF